MENGPEMKIYFLLKTGDIPASYVSLPEGTFVDVIILGPFLAEGWLFFSPKISSWDFFDEKSTEKLKKRVRVVVGHC